MAFTDKHYTLPKNPRKNTEFYEKWGISAVELAERENVTPDAIHMRVRNFGNPFQRKSKPTIFEILYDKTQMEIARENDENPSATHLRLTQFGSPYRTVIKKPGVSEARRLGFAHYERTHKNDNPKNWYSRSKRWLMPEHPDYHIWRKPWLEKTLADPKWAHVKDWVPVED